MTTIGEAVIEVRGDASKFGSDVDRGVKRESGRMGKAGAVAGKGLAVGFTAAAGGILAGGAFLKGAFDEAKEGIRVGAQTAAVIKATGGAAKVSADDVGELTSAISKKTGIDDEAIQSGSNLLLTFKNVRNEVGKGNKVFDRANKAAVDLSAAGFGSIEGGAKMMGKALNDPVAGISALGRAGVTFTAKQKKTIEKMVKTGDVLGAQKIILEEVESQVGGSAKAQATAADKMGVAWGNLKEDVGTKLMPVFEKVFAFVGEKVIPALSDLGPVISDIGGYVGPVVGALKDVFGAFAGSAEASGELEDLKTTFKSVFDSVKAIVKDAVTIVTVLWNAFGSTIVTYARNAFTNLMQIIRGAFTIIQGIFKTVSALLKGDWAGVWDGIKMILKGAVGVITGIVKQWWNITKTLFSVAGIALKAIFGRIWDGVKIVAGKAWEGIKSLVAKGATALVEAVKDIPGKITSGAGHLFAAAGKALIDGFVNAMKGGAGLVSDIAGNVWAAVKSMINSGISAINSALEFRIDLPLGKSVTINPPDIPQLATGGRAVRSGLALVGEKGAEVVKLGRGDTVFPHGTGPGGGGGSTVGLLTITNWKEGTGYFRTVAASEIEADAAYTASLTRMGR